MHTDPADTTDGTVRAAAPTALLDDPDVTIAIRAHADAEVALVEAKHELTRARETVRNALFAAGKRFRDRAVPLPQADLHRLYWEHRELRVSDLASAFAVSTTELARLAGPAEGVGTCDDCAQVVPMLLEARTPKPSYGRRPVRCEPCQDRHETRQELERQRRHELELASIAAGEPLPDRGPTPPHGRSAFDPGW
jgi:AraC-like DNA-binding protein